MTRRPRFSTLPSLLCAGLLVPLGVALGGCWEVLSHQEEEESEDRWLQRDGTLEVSPASLDLATPVGTSTSSMLTFREVSGTAGVEMELALEGEGAEFVTYRPGKWSVIVVPAGSLDVQVTFSPTAGATEANLELVGTTTGSPAEFRIPIHLSLSGS